MKKFSIWILMSVLSTNISLSLEDNANEDDNKIIIIGAGVAGLNAVKTLHDMGHENFLILEGSDHVGGRVKEVEIGGQLFEIGALYVHALGTNPIYELVNKYNLSYIKTNYDDMKIYDESGFDITDKSDSVYEVFESASEKVAELRAEMISHRKPDTTLRQIYITGGWVPKTPLDDVVEYYDLDYELTYTPDANSAIHGTITPNYKAFNSSDNEDVTINDPRGYSYVFRSLLSEVLDVSNDSRILFNKTVTHVHQNSSHVIIQTEDNSSYVGKYVINTFSVGVMQSRLVNFDPPLPKWKIESVDQFQMGAYIHMYFQFPVAFWDNNEYILYASSRRGYYSIWTNIEKLYPNSKILQATLVGEEARRIDRMSDEDIKNEVLSVLQKMFVKKNIVIPEPTAYVIPRWLSDPLFKGSYSNWTPGYTKDTHNGLCAPVDRFYFAGEACTDGFDGYLQGAYFSGKTAAENILKCVNNKPKTCERYIPEYLLRGCTYRGSTNFRADYKTDDGSCKFFICGSSAGVGVSASFYLLFLIVVYHLVSNFHQYA